MATSFTDNPVVADVHEVRALHIAELRNAINTEISRRSGIQRVWTDTSLSTIPNVTPTKIREVHVRELRAASDYAKALDCSTDSSSISVWTNNPIVANVTPPRAIHINELRAYINSLESQCVCNCDGHCACNGQCCNCDHCGSHCSPH